MKSETIGIPPEYGASATQRTKVPDGEARTFEAEYGALCNCKFTPRDPRCRTPIEALLAPISSKSAKPETKHFDFEAYKSLYG